jgi:hypothetical protein
VWLSEPEVPVKVRVAVVDAADAFAETVTDRGVPGVRVTLEGEAVTPVGKPLT